MLSLLKIKSFCSLYSKITKGWNYDNPDSWSEEFPACKGSKQSPIDIDTNKIASRDITKTIQNYFRLAAASKEESPKKLEDIQFVS